MNRKAKIVVTLGPNSQSESAIEQFILAGMDIARINFSHGTYHEHENQIRILRTISNQLKRPIPILQDLQGPRLRVGKLSPQGIELIQGQEVRIAPSTNPKTTNHTAHMIPLDIPDFKQSIRVGNPIMLDDGQIELLVTSIHGDHVKAKVIIGGGT